MFHIKIKIQNRNIIPRKSWPLTKFYIKTRAGHASQHMIFSLSFSESTSGDVGVRGSAPSFGARVLFSMIFGGLGSAERSQNPNHSCTYKLVRI